MKLRERIIVALDTPDFFLCKKWVRSLKGLVSFFKIGSELFTSTGTQSVQYVLDQGGEVFLDLKFHDIPNTVAQVSKAVADLGIKMFNVHALGGLAMMRAAKEAVPTHTGAPWILGVTVLTSLSEEELSGELGIKVSLKNEVLHLAKLAKRAGLNGVVASAQEVSMIKKTLGREFKVVTPGIRPRWSVKGDQHRVVTPREAFGLGADYIVIGRPITGASDLRQAASKVIEEVES